MIFRRRCEQFQEEPIEEELREQIRWLSTRPRSRLGVLSVFPARTWDWNVAQQQAIVEAQTSLLFIPREASIRERNLMYYRELSVPCCPPLRMA